MSSSDTGASGANKYADAFGDTQLVADFGTLSSASEDDDTVVRAEESTQDGIELEGEGGDTLQDPSETVKATKASSKAEANSKVSGEKEVITVTDETGRKRKLEIDYSNREQIKKMAAAAAGMRKFQAERDREIQSRKELETKLKERESDWGRLEEAFQKGHEHLIDTLSGRQGTFQELINKEIDKREFLRNASPEELQTMKAQEQAELTRKELEKIRKENEEFKSTVKQEREQAELRSMESQVHPVFEKYRFADRLGNAQDEHLFDEMLWNSSLKRLEQYEEKGLDLSQELIEKEFKAVATALRNRIGAQAQKKASQVVAQKKQEAIENVQSKVKSGSAGSSDAEKLKQAIASGDTGSIFKNWSTFSKVLSGGRK
jgi:hypothetical protein